MNTCQGVFPLSHFFFSPFCQLNFLLGFYHFFLIRNYKGLENLSLFLQVSTRGMSLLLLPHADVRSTSSFLPVVSHNSEKDYLKAARAFHLQERYYTTPNKLYRWTSTMSRNIFEKSNRLSTTCSMIYMQNSSELKEIPLLSVCKISWLSPYRLLGLQYIEEHSYPRKWVFQVVPKNE